MRILFVASSMGYGGAERVISLLSNELCAQGHEIGIYLTSSSDKCVYQLDERISIYAEKSIKNLAGVIKGIRGYTKRFDPDVVVPFMTYQCMYTCIALMFTKYPIVVCERNDPQTIDGKPAPKYVFWVRNFLFSRAEGAVFQTVGARDMFPSRIVKRGTVINNPIDSSVLPDPYKGTRDNRIVNVGRLSAQKNQSMLISSFAQIKDEFPEISVEIYGDGEKGEELRELCESLGVSDRVHLMGNVSGVCEYIKSARVFAFTSNFEGMPNALAEAMAIGLPCVTTDCAPGGARMLIRDGENGIIVPCNDISGFANALKSMLRNPDKSEEMGACASSIRETLSVKNIALEWESYFAKIIK